MALFGVEPRKASALLSQGYNQMKKSNWLGVALFAFAGCILLVPELAHAQSLPSGCVPAGSTYECLDVMEEPWDYTHNTCGTHEYRASEEESFQDELNTWTNVCDLQTTRIGWYTTPSTV